MNIRKITMGALLIATAATAKAADNAMGNNMDASAIDTVTIRIKAMRCDDCAHKVYTALSADEGVEDVDFNLERRTITVAYDAAKTCPDSINARLRATKRYMPTAYSKDDVIKRGYGQRIDDMFCKNCANRIMSVLSKKEGIDSLAPHLDKHYMFIRYDANRTCRDSIRAVINSLGYTPVNYYTSDKVAFAYYIIPDEAATQETIDKIKTFKAVDDVNVNPKRHSLAVTYFCQEMSAEELLEGIKAKGIDAKLPPAHVCKEEQKGEE